MIRSLLCTSIVCLLLPQQTQANDIVDFLRAVSGSSPRAYAGHGHEVNHHDHRAVSYRPTDRRARLTQAPHVTASRLHGSRAASQRVVSPRVVNSRATRRPTRTSGLSFHVSIGSNSPAVPRYVPKQQFPVGDVALPLEAAQHGGHLPAPPLPDSQLPIAPLPSAPVPGQFGHLPHQLGEIVTCSVPVFAHVHVESAYRIAPNAVPTLVAVRDPNLGRFRSCIEQMVYVEVLVPPSAPRRVKVSACRTRIRMDYGRYEVTIVSRDGHVTVEYDN